MMTNDMIWMAMVETELHFMQIWGWGETTHAECLRWRRAQEALRAGGGVLELCEALQGQTGEYFLATLKKELNRAP
jgi:hypothetical protein